MSDKTRTLPDYDAPPIIETVLGVRFAPLTPFTTRIFGRYWDTIKDKYPKFEIQDPIPQTREEFGAARARTLGIQIFKSPNFRCWFIDETETRLIQVQRDGFFHNWRKVKDDDSYLHYEYTKPNFEQHWLAFCQFLKDEGISRPDVDQCEVTYINHIEMGQGWTSYGELNKVISCWSGLSSSELLRMPENASFNIQYVIPDQKGRLHITLQPAIRQKDAKEVLQLTLTARGNPKSSDIGDIASLLDLGHDWIVTAFTDITTNDMHVRWRRKI